MTLRPDIASIIVAKARQYGQNPDYMLRQAEIESGGNPAAQNPRSSAGGLFQFTDGTAGQYGLTDKFDPVASSDAAARLARDNGAYLAKQLGRDPTSGELYLAHQQGMGGAAKLLTHPDALAVDLVGAKAVTGNGGTPDMTALQFANRWTGKFDGSGPAMTMPGGTAASGSFGLSGIEPSTAPAPQMTMPTAKPDDGLDIARLLQGLTTLQATQQQPAAQPAAQPQMPAPQPRPTALFDPSAFYALLNRRSR